MDKNNTDIEVAMDPSAFPRQGAINMDHIEQLSIRLSSLVERIKDQAFLPTGRKKSPVFGLVQLAALCHLTADSMSRRLAKAEELGLPAGTIVPSKTSIERQAQSQDDIDDDLASSDTQEEVTSPEAGKKGKKGAEPKGNSRRQWTLAEARQWIKACGIPLLRTDSMLGAVITTANFKGGVGKTFTTMSLAQGLTLMGYKVLVIDFDPQGSLTSLFGILPTEVSDDMTVLPIMQPPFNSDGSKNEEARPTIKESIQETYWDGLDLVAGSRSLFAGEFFLPSRQMRLEPDFNFYEVLHRSLNDGTREKYDYILIDTMPALSYLTINTMWAADSILMPLPPEGLDIASSSQFWNMFTELASAMPEAKKTFQWIGVLPSKVDNTKSHTKSLLKWIQAGYGDFVLPVEIPMTQVVNVSGTELRTVYDITKYGGAAKTYARARDAYDKLVAEVDHLTRQTCWKKGTEQ